MTVSSLRCICICDQYSPSLPFLPPNTALEYGTESDLGKLAYIFLKPMGRRDALMPWWVAGWHPDTQGLESGDVASRSTE